MSRQTTRLAKKIDANLIEAPRNHVMGTKLYARVTFVESVISATMLFMRLLLLLTAPPRQRLDVWLA